MAEFEIVSQSTEYETMLHGVMPVRGISFEDYHETSGVGIDPVKKMLIDELPGFINQLAWVDLTKRASVNIRHNEPRVVKPYGLPDYPDEVVSGRRVSYGDSYFVTDRDDQELEFTPFAEVFAQKRLSEYMSRWMGSIAAGNHFPNFWAKLSNRVTDEMVAPHRDPNNDSF